MSIWDAKELKVYSHVGVLQKKKNPFCIEFLENFLRCIPSEFIPYINTSSWQIPILFKFLKEKGSIPEKDFWNTFNLGVGFCLIIDKQYKDAILSICKDHDIDSWEIGKVVRKNDSTISKFLPEILT